MSGELTAPRTSAEYRAWWEANTSVPYGFCWCGCGRRTPSARQGNTKLNRVRGEPIRYVPEHAGRKMTEAQERQACQFYLSGETLAQVAKRFNVTATTISGILKKHGVEARVSRLFSDEDESTICQLYAGGMTGVEIAQLYDCSHEVVYRVLKRHGVNHSARLVETERLTLAQEAQVCRRYLSGHAPHAISESMGLALDSVNLALEVWQIGPQQDSLSVEAAGAISDGLGVPLANVYGAVLRANAAHGSLSGVPPSKRDEAVLRDGLAQYLAEHGLNTRTEAQMPVGGRCDIAAGAAEELQLIVEVKVADPLRGIGQLFSYKSGWYPKPSLALAIPSEGVDWLPLNIACFEAGVELWLVEPDGSPHRLCGPSGTTYPHGIVPSAFEDMWLLR